MNKKVMEMQKAKNVTKYVTCLIFLASIGSCASQVIGTIDKDKMAYELIKHHYSNDSNQKRNKILIHHKTLNKESPYFLNRKFGLSNFLRHDKSSLSSKKCYIDSIFSKEAQQKLDSAYVNFKQVELDQKKIKLKKIELIYAETDLDERKVVSYITFPAVIQIKGVFYAIMTDSDKLDGRFYFYKYRYGKWELICQRMLYVT